MRTIYWFICWQGCSFVLGSYHFGMLLPAILPLFKALRNHFHLQSLHVRTVVVAAWLKRYLIVILGLAHPYLPIQDVPDSWKHYSPSLVEMTIVAATFAAMLLIVTLFTRFFQSFRFGKLQKEDWKGRMKSSIINNRLWESSFYNIIAWMMASIPVFTYAQDKDAKITLSFDVVDSVKHAKRLLLPEMLR